MFAYNIDCGHTLELRRRGGSNEYPQSMFLNKNKKNRYTPANPGFFLYIYKSEVYGIYILRTCFPDVFFLPISDSRTVVNKSMSILLILDQRFSSIYYYYYYYFFFFFFFFFYYLILRFFLLLLLRTFYFYRHFILDFRRGSSRQTLIVRCRDS